ncbi:hypothetical protein P152DRAFT_478463 [Eremomyces bilateralis CBS 781.70]|uniref:Rhodopsin domain-containing protein n=1 Tax=Eremomyces bilateralis CBS 781.70 TaxID=1392243 RepID=A0A6G1GHA8_9PEZI|nr:uncharacterized protein P152DRAFT_478463 [Eremomyces bilateralis CBS 781.70]KAF1817487.1 hypothetical protein P152DRAFT_478463 [Eremomyces bilateralis CBS 781.70]
MAPADGSDHLTVSSADKKAIIAIVAILGLTWSVIFYFVRGFIRLRISGPISWDDYLATFATVVGVTQTGVTLDGVRHGLGQSSSDLSAGDIRKALQAHYASFILYIVTICSTQASMALLITRLTRTKHHLSSSNAATLFIIMAGFINIFVASFQCRPPHPWDTSDVECCKHITVRWAVVETMNILIEILLFSLSVFLVWSLYMPVKIKLTVCAAFLCRLLIIPSSILRVIHIHVASLGSDATLDATYPAVLTQVGLHYSLIATTIPCMKKFLKQFDSGFGATMMMSDGSYAASPTRDDHALSSIPVMIQHNTRGTHTNETHTSVLDSYYEPESEEPPLLLRPDHLDYMTDMEASGGRFQAAGTRSAESQSIHTEVLTKPLSGNHKDSKSSTTTCNDS